MAKEDDAAAKAAAEAHVAAEAAEEEANLPGKDCASLQPELVSDRWCKENCGLSKWSGPVGSDSCDRNFCKCPGDEERKQEAPPESEAPRGRQNADGSISPPSENGGDEWRNGDDWRNGDAWRNGDGWKDGSIFSIDGEFQTDNPAHL